MFAFVMATTPKSSKHRPWLPKHVAFQRHTALGVNSIDNSFYNSSQWRKLRKRYITEFPLCEVCERSGVVRAASVVDHIKPSRLFPESRTEWSNLQAMCKKHHDTKSQIESRMKEKHDYYKLNKGRGAKLFIHKS